MKIIIGIVIGFINGMFSSGGGLIAIPCFEKFLKMDKKKSRAVTIFCILPMCITSLIVLKQKQQIDYKLGIICGLGGMVGGFVGSKLLNRISDKVLEIFFIMFLIYSGVKLLI